ncbi:YihY/virulence factor BrkB family protein [Edaphobacter bradus]|uniref:YihY/virulence factor BrkB family protein n=1 Tax=Edaphobacter bradus TaxID=2259016 RepID=UPI0021DFB0B5|nr:YihY/virulence factor BrkB family protein [Edaphobacter bradus]
MKKLLRIPVVFHSAALSAADHDAFNLAQSAAYSAMLSLFPALIFAASIIALLPGATHIRGQVGTVFSRLLPPEVIPLLAGYFAPASSHYRSANALIVAFFFSVTGASGVIVTFMEGIRRAHGLPYDCWTFWGRRLRAYVLVPLCLVPFAIASSLVVFGHYLTVWIAFHVDPEISVQVYFIALTLRWLIAFTGSVGLIAVLYHMGTPLRQPWKRVVPGAITATAMWFLTTLVFGWYVTRFANYAQVYGSLGAGIALLFWLYIVSLSVLCGAEFNAQVNRHIHNDAPVVTPNSNASVPRTAPRV